MKKSLLVLALLIKYSSVLSMESYPVEQVKRQINQLRTQGISKAELAQIASDSLRILLDHPLLYADTKGYIDFYQTLVEAGADKNVAHPKNGKTALMFAALDGRPDIFSKLLALGVDHTIRDTNGCTAAQQYPVSNETTISEIQCLFEEAELAAKLKKLKYS